MRLVGISGMVTKKTLEWYCLKQRLSGVNYNGSWGCVIVQSKIPVFRGECQDILVECE